MGTLWDRWGGQGLPEMHRLEALEGNLSFLLGMLSLCVDFSVHSYLAGRT